MGFYSCVAKSSIGEATWNSWLRKQGKFIHQSSLAVAFSRFVLRVANIFQASGLILSSKHYVGGDGDEPVHSGGRCESGLIYITIATFGALQLF